MTDKAVIFNMDTFTDKGMRGNLAVFTNKGVLLNFYKRADFGIIADFTAVEIDEVVDFDIFTEFDVVDIFHKDPLTLRALRAHSFLLIWKTLKFICYKRNKRLCNIISKEIYQQSLLVEILRIGLSDNFKYVNN